MKGRLIYSDLSALEYRLIAHSSKDRKLVRLFKTDEDIHESASQRVFGYEIGSMSTDERKEGKTNNYLAVYGGGYDKFLAQTGLPRNKETYKLFKLVKNLYPKVNAWKRRLEDEIYRRKGLITPFGRVRFVEEVDDNIVRELINWYIQSMGHDILKIYIIEVMKYVKALLVAETHDSFTLDSKPQYVKSNVKIVKEISSDLNGLIYKRFGVRMIVPIKADVEVLKRWK